MINISVFLDVKVLQRNHSRFSFYFLQLRVVLTKVMAPRILRMNPTLILVA